MAIAVATGLAENLEKSKHHFSLIIKSSL